MQDKLRIDVGTQPDGTYGPFYVMCDVVVKDGIATPVLSEDARVFNHVYRLEDGNTMKMTAYCATCETPLVAGKCAECK